MVTVDLLGSRSEEAKMIKIRLFALVCLSTLALAACGDGGSDGAAGTASSSSANSTGAPAAPVTTGADSGSGGVSAAEICDYLRGELPDLRKAPGEIDAMGRLAFGLSGWYEQQGEVPDGAEMDKLTKEECADVRTEVLELAGVQSFMQL
ncbi:hypothetical protein ABGB07_42550 [Micromonosporaceae bacterium B7E4]